MATPIESEADLQKGTTRVDVAESFETFLGSMPEHLERYHLDRRYKQVHVAKVVRCNWKLNQEAFIEGYHVIATHPQILEFTADENSEYSIWPDSPFVTRFVNGFGLQSPHLEELSDQQVVDAYIAFSVGSVKGKMPEGARVEVPEGTGSRAVVAEVFRTAMSGLYGADLSDRSDTEMLDATLYHLFPAFAPWAGVGQSLVYRWRPGKTPDTCLMEVRILARVTDPTEGLGEVHGRVGSLLEVGTGFHPELTGRENLEMFGRLFKLSREDAGRRAGELLERFARLNLVTPRAPAIQEPRRGRPAARAGRSGRSHPVPRSRRCRPRRATPRNGCSSATVPLRTG